MLTLIDAKKDKTDEKMKEFYSILDKLIASFDNMLHQNQISYPDNDVEDYGPSEITKSTSKTKHSKSNPSSFSKLNTDDQGGQLSLTHIPLLADCSIRQS